MSESAAPFALFVSSVEGAPVTRFGTRTIIGATRSTLAPTVLVFDTEQIVAIPHDEYRRYRREYDRALDNGSLKRRAVADWEAQNRRLERAVSSGGQAPPSAPPAA